MVPSIAIPFVGKDSDTGYVLPHKRLIAHKARKVRGHILTNSVRNRYNSTLANALAGGPQNVGQVGGTSSARGQFLFNIYNMNFTIPKGLGNDWGLPASPFVEVMFDISLAKHESPMQFCAKTMTMVVG